MYQGRYKSFPVEEEDDFCRLVRYVERNALRAGLGERAEALEVQVGPFVSNDGACSIGGCD